jgi:hypothetical protein
LDLTGLVNRVYDAVAAIHFGRKGFAIRGKEQAGSKKNKKGITKFSSVEKLCMATI